jgi:hypothetical protein
MPALNPENPFVADDQFFASYANKTVYKETPLYWIRLVNDTLVFLMAIFLGSLLFYLITYQMPSHFRPYRKMLVLSTTVDTYAMIVNFMLQLVSFVL